MYLTYLKINKSGNSTSLEIKQIQIKARRCLFSVVKLKILKVKSIIPLKKKYHPMLMSMGNMSVLNT